MGRKHTFNIGYFLLKFLALGLLQLWFAYRDSVRLVAVGARRIAKAWAASSISENQRQRCLSEAAGPETRLTTWPAPTRQRGTSGNISAAFIRFVLASIVATLAPIPFGLGSSCGTCVVMLHMMRFGVEAALAATLSLRGLTFWLPMFPGLWLIHAETVRLLKSER